MSAGLHTDTYQRLSQFLARHRSLLSTKGVAATIFIAIVAMLMIVGVDAMWVLSDSIRWALAGTFYLLIATVAVLLALVPWLRKGDLPTAARTIETKMPPLREKLLSAVELANERPDQSSAAFRNHLQTQVAETIRGVDIKSLLPWSSIRKWILIAMASIGVLIGLCLVPDWQVPYRIVRALFPAANLGRLSRYQIDIIAPKPASNWVPQDEMVDFQVAVAGPSLTSIQIESKDGKFLTLRPTDSTSDGKQVFTTSMKMVSSIFDYRVIAGDGSSSWYRLKARTRPKVTEFRKVIDQPSYAEVEPTTLVDEHGNVQAVVGSLLHLQLSVDQPIREAWIQLRSLDAKAEESQKLPLSIDEDHLAIDIPIERDATYRVHLIAAETNFDNAQSPSYRIQARVDQPPKISWVQPKEKSLLNSPQDILELEVKVEDEYPIADLSQWTRVNNGEWSIERRALPIGTAPSIQWKWDLAKQRLRKGDSIQTRLLAEDRKGQRTESSIVSVLITEIELSAGVSESTAIRTEALDLLTEITKESSEMLAAMQNQRNEWTAQQQSDEKRKELQTKMEAYREKMTARLPELDAQLSNAANNSQDSVSQQEIESARKAVAKLMKETLPELAAQLDSDPTNDIEPNAAPAQQMQQALNKLDEANHKINQMRNTFRPLTSYEVLRDLAHDLDDAFRFQEEVLQKKDDFGSETWRRREEALVKHLAEVGKVLVEEKSHVRDHVAPQLQELANWTATVAAQHQQTLEAIEAQPDKAAEIAKNGSQRILDEIRHRRNPLGFEGGLANESLAFRRELDEISGVTSQSLQKLAQAMNIVADEKKDLPNGKAELFKQSIDQLADRRDASFDRTDGDRQFGADLGAAQRAVESLLEKNNAPDANKKQVATDVKAVADAMQKLEAIHAAKEAATQLSELQNDERWQSNTFEGRSDHPRSVEALSEQLEKTAVQLRVAGIPNEIANEFTQMRWSPEMQQAQQKINPRRWTTENVVNAAPDLDALSEKLKQLQSKLAETEAQAREAIEAHAPSIAELAKKSAEQAKKLEQKEEELAQAADRGEVPDPSVHVRQQAKEHQSAMKSLNNLTAALEDMAATKNLLNETQRQQARDADLGRVLAQDAQDNWKEANDKATQAAPMDESKKRVAELAESQHKAADTLEKIAQHFENLSNIDTPKENTDSSRDALRELAKQLPKLNPTDSQYAEAERLAKLANADPRALLKRLEQELGKNPEMRQELSKIAKDLVERSQDSLEQSAAQEKSLQSRAEDSDPSFQVRKQVFHQELSYTSSLAQTLANRLQGDAQTQAAHGKQPEQQKQLLQASQQLTKSIQQAQQVPGNAPLREMEKAASDLKQAVKAAEAQVRDAAQKLSGAAGEKKFEKPEELDNATKQANEVARRNQEQDVQQAQQRENWRNDRAREANDRATQADNLLNQAKQQRDQAKQQLDQRPNDANALLQHQQAESRVQSAETFKQSMDTLKQKRDAQANAAKTDREQTQAKAPATSNAQNPASDIGGKLSDQFAGDLGKIGTELEQSLADLGWKEQLAESTQFLNGAKQEQANVSQNVAEAARSVDRAAAHEKRLQNQENAKQLAQQAQQIAQSPLAAAKHAENTLKNAADSPAAKSGAQKATPETSRGTQQALQNAEQTLRNQADQLAKNIENAAKAEANSPSQANAQPNNQQANNQQANGQQSSDSQASSAQNQPSADGKSNQPDSSSPSNAAPASSKPPLDAATMARMLDELDRELRNPNAAIPKSDQNASASQRNSTPSSLDQAAKSLAAKMSKQRMQGDQQAQKSSSKNARQLAMSDPTESDSTEASEAMDTARHGAGDSNISNVDLSRIEVGAWSKLREQNSEKTTETAKEVVSPKYRKKIEAYYRGLSERSKK